MIYILTRHNRIYLCVYKIVGYNNVSVVITLHALVPDPQGQDHKRTRSSPRLGGVPSSENPPSSLEQTFDRRSIVTRIKDPVPIGDSIRAPAVDGSGQLCDTK